MKKGPKVMDERRLRARVAAGAVRSVRIVADGVGIGLTGAQPYPLMFAKTLKEKGSAPSRGLPDDTDTTSRRGTAKGHRRGGWGAPEDGNAGRLNL